jgi:transketolase
MNKKTDFLKHKAYRLRRLVLQMTTKAGSGHATSCLSCAEIMAMLFFDVMCFDPDNYENPNNDRFILSKGHAAPILYAIWHELGKVSQKELFSYRTLGSSLEGHPTRRFLYTECATGSLGIGLSVGVGESLYAKMESLTYKTFVLLGDSELSEGSIWESVFIAAQYKLDNLVAIIDMNRLGQSTETMFANHAEKYKVLFAACGWHPIVVKNGHDIVLLKQAFAESVSITGKPVVIIADTIKGYGVTFAENKNGFHGKAFDEEQLSTILPELETRFSDAVSEPDFSWEPLLPPNIAVQKQKKIQLIQKPSELFKEKKIPTRKAFGIVLAELGTLNECVVSLDAEVKNSTYAEIFESAHPNRFFQCFVAEQNMIGSAIGFASRGAVPFVSTFSCFLSRAFDQIRMAAIGTAAIKIVGSHAGVSIGQDGPSQMGLEDIAMMKTVQNSVIFYPCDAISTAKVMNVMLQYNDGICYLRTTREATEVIYNDSHEFELGGFQVLKKSQQDMVVIIAAGVTVFESLKAYEMLQKEEMFVRVIDLYCVKPLNAETLTAEIRASNGKVVIVEDHYKDGGIGESIMATLCNKLFYFEHLGIFEIPTSGSQEEQRRFHQIDAKAIVEAVKQVANK